MFVGRACCRGIGVREWIWWASVQEWEEESGKDEKEGVALQY